MSGVNVRLAALLPDAPAGAGTDAPVSVPADRLPEVAQALRTDADEPMDYLRDIVGMDWGTEIGALYYLECTRTGSRVTLRVAIPRQEVPVLPSVYGIWRTAELKEREVMDFFGIRFTGHPDMRRLFLREDSARGPYARPPAGASGRTRRR